MYPGSTPQKELSILSTCGFYLKKLIFFVYLSLLAVMWIRISCYMDSEPGVCKVSVGNITR